MLGALVLSSCRPPLTTTYTVSIPHPQTGVVEVGLRLENVPRDSLRLRTYTSPRWMGLSDLAVADSKGRPIPATLALQDVEVSGRTVDIGRWTLHGPLPSEVVVHYRVRPGRREGDAHTGFAGRCSGYLGAAFGLFTGRNVFLVPDVPEQTLDLAVVMSGPLGWRSVTTWNGTATPWRPGLHGRHAAEHLIAGVMAMGRFRESAVRIGATLYRFEVDASASPDDAARSVERLASTARWIHDRFGRDLGDEYVTVVAPEAPNGDEILGEAWATGQGATLRPATASRLHGFARELSKAYLVFPPFRSEIRDPADFWLVDAMTEWLSRRAAARAENVGDQELLRESAVAYMDAFRAHNVERDLEALYARGAPSRAASESIAPFVIAAVDQEIRDPSRGTDSLDRFLPSIFPRGPARSFWSALPGGSNAWATFRERYVRGGGMIMASRYFHLQPTAPDPDSTSEMPARRLTILYTGNTYGFLENCGCKSNQSGGVARRATVIRQALARDPAALILDAGSSLARADDAESPDYLSREEQRLYVTTMNRARFRASAVGTTDLSYGLDYFRAVTAEAAFPYLAANVRRRGTPIAPADTVLRIAGLRIGVVGILEPPVELTTIDAFQRHTADLAFDDPIRALRDIVPALRKRCDLVVVMGRLMPGTIREIVRAYPDVGMILSTEYHVPTQLQKVLEPTMSKNDAQGFLGRTLVLYTTLMNYGLGEARLGLDRAGRIVQVEAMDHWLGSDVPDDAAVRDLLSRFYERVGRQDAAQASVVPPFAEDRERMEERYAGAQACAHCHAMEFEQWKGTRHASAFKTLLDRHRHYQPRCVSCHVVGYGARYGYRLGDREEPLGNVQCEICHGPGDRHARDPRLGSIRKEVPAAVCLTCHTPEHSDAFVYTEKLPLVRHHSSATASLIERPARAIGR